ncbi:MAG: VWA domain-containing protein [Bryobacterales bacterium]|nr:VWA domain-containing protein [Bryobacterales bacterium]
MKYASLLALAGILAAQDPRFEVQSRVVLVPAAVSDRKGKILEGLQSSDFSVLDNARPQKAVVDSFATGVAPIALVVAVQASGISEPALAKIRKVGAMIQPLITGDRGCGALLQFSERVQWLQECTKDGAALSDAFDRLSTGDHKTARMIDAVREAVDKLKNGTNFRRVILLISESRDRGSQTDLEAAVVAANAADVTVYALTYSAFRMGWATKGASRDEEESSSIYAPGNPPPTPDRYPRPTPTEQRVDILGGIKEATRLANDRVTEELATSTGGFVFSFTKQKGLEDSIQKLGTELQTQYVLSFRPEAATVGFHKLEVRVRGHKNIQVRSRPGYWITEGP